MKRNDDIKFLKDFLADRRDALATTYKILPTDLGDVDIEEGEDSLSAKFERAARLADKYGLDGSVFRPDAYYCDNAQQKFDLMVISLKERVKLLPRVIAAIEEAAEAVAAPSPTTNGQKPNWSEPCTKTFAAEKALVSVDHLNDYIRRNPSTVHRISRQKWIFDKNHPFFRKVP